MGDFSDAVHVPTPGELIELFREQAACLGLIGLSSTFQPLKIVQSISLNEEATPDIQRREHTVIDVMMEAEMQLLHESSITSKLQDMTLNHPSVLKKADEIINKRLLAAGTEPKLLEMWKIISAPLQMKVVRLHELEHPPAKSPRRVKVFFLRQTQTSTEMEVIYLPIDIPLTEVHAALRSLSATIDCSGQSIESRGSGPWMYKFISTKRELSSGDERLLLVDADYSILMKQMTKKNSSNPCACIFQVRLWICRRRRLAYQYLLFSSPRLPFTGDLTSCRRSNNRKSPWMRMGSLISKN